MLLNSRELRIEWLKLLRLFLQKCKPTNKPISSLILCRVILISFELFISISRIKHQILYNNCSAYNCCHIPISSSNLFIINPIKSRHWTHGFCLWNTIFTRCFWTFITVGFSFFYCLRLFALPFKILCDLFGGFICNRLIFQLNTSSIFSFFLIPFF